MDMANQFLSLALFIMLLAFFIILNGVSAFEDTKSAPVLNSIAQTFSGKKVEIPLAANVVESPDESTNEGDTLDKLKSLFNAHITGVEVRKNRLGTQMHVRMSVDNFQRAINLPTNADGSFLPTLASLVQATDSDVAYRMDIVFNTEKSPADFADDPAEQLKNNVRKISQITQKIEQIGVPKKLISVGLSKGEVGNVDIYFRRYEPFNPLDIQEIKTKTPETETEE